ncbi:MAG: porin [Planctomycetaceae bacterium]|jgi:predicted porin|nr:porin [Planctomycetaceae bacterium]
MKTIITFTLTVLLTAVSVAVYAGSLFDTSECNPCEPVCESIFNTHPRDFNSCLPCYEAFGCKKRKSLFDSIEFSGWLQGGVYTNTHGATTQRYRAPNAKGRIVSFQDETSGNSQLLSTVAATDFQINQLWLNLGKQADTSHGFDWGFEAEYVFGQDAWISQSWNDALFDYGWQSGDYYSSIPQLYFQLAYGDWSVKAGKYETLVGTESFRAKDFFFYSHSQCFLSEPYSHSGALAEYTPNEKLYAAFGYTTGGDSSFENRYDDHGVLANVSYQFTPKLNLSYAVLYTRYSNQALYPGLAQRGNAGENLYFQTVYANYALSKKITYMFQWDWGGAKLRQDGTHRIMYGINNYLLYHINKNWSIGARAEWAKDKHGDYLGYYGGEFFGLTLGLNWQPHRNLKLTPEIQYDRTNGSRPFNYGTDAEQVSGGIGATISF